MTADLQQLVERLAHQLGRSVAIDDRRLRLLAHSTHYGPVDEARKESILNRHVPQAVIEHVKECGAADATDIFTVSVRPEAGLDIARIGAPIRHQHALQGYVWLLESEGPLSADESEALREAADAAATIMHRQYLQNATSAQRERELVGDLLGEDEGQRTIAADALIAESRFTAGPVTAMVATVVRDVTLTDQDRLAITAAAEMGRRSRAERGLLVLERHDHVVILLAQGADRSKKCAQLGKAIREKMLSEASEGTEVWVGISDPHTSLIEAAGAYADARRTASVAGTVGLLGHVVNFADLHVYGLLSELPVDRLAIALDSGVRRLLDRGSHGDDALAVTMEAFLDNGCDVKLTTQHLHIHRATLYHRLNRAREITGLDHNDGQDRLTLHLGFKIARLVRQPR